MKYAVPLLLLFAVGLVLSFTELWRGKDDGKPRELIPNYSWAEMNDIFTRERDIDQRVERMRGFRAKNEAVKAGLKAATMTLREGANVMASATREFNPDLLKTLRDRYSPLSVEEQVALWLISQLEAEAAESLKEEEACQLECLRAELKDWSALNSTVHQGGV